MMLMTTAYVTCSNATGVVTTTTFRLLFQQRRIRRTLVQISIHYANYEAATRRGWFTLYNRHRNNPLTQLPQSRYLDLAQDVHKLSSNRFFCQFHSGYAWFCP